MAPCEGSAARLSQQLHIRLRHTASTHCCLLSGQAQSALTAAKALGCTGASSLKRSDRAPQTTAVCDQAKRKQQRARAHTLLSAERSMVGAGSFAECDQGVHQVSELPVSKQPVNS